MMENNATAANTSLALMQASQAKSASLSIDAKNASKDKNMAQIEMVAKDFEAVFVAEMMKPMFAGVKVNGMFGGGKGEEIFRGILIQEYGKMMAESGQLGISDAVKAEMIRMQETASGVRR